LKSDWHNLELTAFFCLQELMTLPPTSPPSTSSSPHRSCTAQRSTPSLSPPPQAGLCLPALPSDGSAPLDVSPQQPKRSPFKNRPPWAPGAVKNIEASGARLLSTAARPGEHKYGNRNESSDELSSAREILGAHPLEVDLTVLNLTTRLRGFWNGTGVHVERGLIG